MTRKRKRVPEVLRRLFHDRARPLADTILSLIPPKCGCNGRECLSCRRGNARSILVRHRDPPVYRKLLNRSFAVVSENAPLIAAFDPQHRLPQREIVRRSIEMIIHENSSSLNLICCSYNGGSSSSTVVDELMSSKWTLLLSRVGDDLMIYLLKYTSLFLPLPRTKHCQITGCPISILCYNFLRRMPNPKHQNYQHGSRMKRERANGVVSINGKRLRTSSLAVEHSLKSIKFAKNNGTSCFASKELTNIRSEGGSKQDVVSSQKRKRQYRWQRQRKRRQLIGQKTCSLIPRGGNICSGDTSSRGLQSSICTTSSSPCDENIIDCFCCSILKNVPRMSTNAEIDRQKLFFRLYSSTSVFPRNHTLHTLKPNSSGASVLFNDIFGTFCFDKNPGTRPCFHSDNSCPAISTCLYHSLIKLLKRLIRKARNCPCQRLLEKHCSIRSSSHDSKTAGHEFEGHDSQVKLSGRSQDGNQVDENTGLSALAKNCKFITDETVDHSESSKCYCPKKQVVSFIWAVCRRIVPPSLLGETSNWRVLRKNISKFIQVRKYEKFSLRECIHKLKISKFPLLANDHCKNMNNGYPAPHVTDSARHAILECWVYWFFAHLVSPLVQGNFYITESENGRQEVFYYKKSTWERMTKEGECMKGKTYRLMNHAFARKLLQKRSLGFSRARLLPKKIGFRLLANLQAPSKMPVNVLPTRIRSNQKFKKEVSCNQVKFRFFKSVNSVLRDVHVVLKGLYEKGPGKSGSSVFDYNDVYRKLVPFLFLLKNGSTNLSDVFIVVADVSKAFDSINHDKLLNVMNDIIVHNEYALEKFTQVICTKRSLKVDQHQKLANKDIAPSSDEYTSWLPTQSLGGVLVKKELSRKIKKEEIYLLLKEHITRNVVQFCNNFYLQSVGIPQGSVLSTLLCTFYYEHMERNVIFPFLDKVNKALLEEKNAVSASDTVGNHRKEMVAGGPKNLLLRFIDDYLFISTSKKQASMFFTRLDRGVHNYNCYMNVEKYGLNFNVSNGHVNTSNRLYIGEDGVSFLRWSGLLVNCSTLEIQADYTRYLNSHLSSTLTASCLGKVGRQLKEKLRVYLMPKCHPIFYDSNINSPGVVRLNIYQSFLLCAMKFICYISKLSILPKFSSKFYFNAISASLRYMSRITKRKMHSFSMGNAFLPKYDVRNAEVVWLGLYAYNQAFKKKQSHHRELLRKFRSKLKAHGKVDSMSPELSRHFVIRLVGPNKEREGKLFCKCVYGGCNFFYWLHSIEVVERTLEEHGKGELSRCPFGRKICRVIDKL